MSRGSGRAQSAPANPTPAPPEEVKDQAVDEQDLVASDPYDVLEGRSPEEAVASSLGAPNDYPYFDKTRLPMHERELPMNSSNAGPSQSDLNPGFTPKPEDGGPSKEKDGEQVIEGTEPNALEKAADAAENAGGPEARAEVEAAQQEAAEKQMDAAAVQKDAEDKAAAEKAAAEGQTA